MVSACHWPPETNLGMDATGGILEIVDRSMSQIRFAWFIDAESIFNRPGLQLGRLMRRMGIPDFSFPGDEIYRRIRGSVWQTALWQYKDFYAC